SFAFGERTNHFRLPRRQGPFGYAPGELCSYGGRNPALTISHRVDAVDEVLRGSIFENVPLGASSQRAVNIFFTLITSDNDHMRRGFALVDGHHGFDAVHHR